jgi:hypothetical protein
MEGVHVQLEEFENTLWGNLLRVDMDYAYWEEFDELSRETLNNIHQIMNVSFDEMYKRYEGTEVVTLLDRINSEIKMMIRVGMNVPFPLNPEFHIDRVFLNIQYEVNYLFADLRQAMLQTNHNVHIVQRTWRRAISDPNYLACRRRLEYEFNELAQEINLRV